MQAETKTITKTQHILQAMQILSWVAFIGFLIETGAILFSYIVSLVNPEVAGKLYKLTDLSHLRGLNLSYYTIAVSFMVALGAMKAYIAYLLIRVLTKVNLADPFKMKVALLLEKISHILLGAFVVALLNSLNVAQTVKDTGVQLEEWPTGEIIFIAGIVYIFSQVFKRGVEIQSEHDLTV